MTNRAMTTAPPPGVSFGCLKRTTVCGDGSFPVTSLERLPESAWEEVDLSALCQGVHTQADGRCCGHAGVQVARDAQLIQGTDGGRLSAADLYDGAGGVWGSGITLDSALFRLTTKGVALEASVPSNTRYVAQPPPGERERNRILEWHDLLGDIGRVAHCLKLKRTAIIGLTWPGGGGHAVKVDGMKKRDGKWYFRGPNSWGPTWNVDGWWELLVRQLRNMDAYGAWMALSAVVPSDGPTPERVVMTLQEALREARLLTSLRMMPRRWRPFERSIDVLRLAVVDAWPRLGTDRALALPLAAQSDIAGDLYERAIDDKRVGSLGWFFLSVFGPMILRWIIARVVKKWGQGLSGPVYIQ